MFLAHQDWSNSDHLEMESVCDLQLPTPASFRPVQSPRDILSALEQCVVALSLFDHPSSIAPPSTSARLMGWIFGTYATNQLADARLEALRRFCILLRQGGGMLSAEEEGRARDAGLSSAALMEARRLVARGRSR
jgi:hypothetical protein